MIVQHFCQNLLSFAGTQKNKSRLLLVSNFQKIVQDV